jgi:hypothetical protein
MSTICQSPERDAVSSALPFITTDLDLASYLKTIGRRLIGTQPQGRFVAFHFEPSASADAQMYLTGASAPAQSVLATYRELRTLITKTERQKNYARTSNSHTF